MGTITNINTSDVTRTFRAWDFSTTVGGGFVVLRAGWCPTLSRTTVHQHAAYMGEGWHGRDIALREWSVNSAETALRSLWSVPVEIRRCTCGCLTTVQ